MLHQLFKIIGFAYTCGMLCQWLKYWQTNETKGSILLYVDHFTSILCLFKQKNIPPQTQLLQLCPLKATLGDDTGTFDVKAAGIKKGKFYIKF